MYQKKSVLCYDTGRMLLDVPELLLLIVRIVGANSGNSKCLTMNFE